jgi:hypothetical protein
VRFTCEGETEAEAETAEDVTEGVSDDPTESGSNQVVGRGHHDTLPAPEVEGPSRPRIEEKGRAEVMKGRAIMMEGRRGTRISFSLFEQPAQRSWHS